MKPTRYILIAALAVGLSGVTTGCNIYKKYTTPDSTPLLKEYKEAIEQPVDSAIFGNLRWQQVFTDPILADLIQRALDHNTDLANAKLNVDIAQAQLQGAKLAYLPSLTIGANEQGSRYFNFAATPSMSWNYQIPLSANWEIDIFAKLLNGKRSAQASLRNSQAYCQAVRSQIIGGVANTYYTLAAMQAQLQTSLSTAKLWEQNIQTMADLKEAGRVTEVAVVQSKAQYYGIMASIADIEVSIDQMQSTLSLLVGTMPQQWSVSPDAMLQSPVLLRSSIPMVELASRPDVAAAEQSLAMAYYSTNSARAAFYPSINISATGGFTDAVGSAIVHPGKFFINLAASLTAPLFSRGQNIARLKAAKAQQQQALNSFEYSLMNASAEVSDAMTLYAKSAEKCQAVALQTQELQKAVDYTTDLLKLGGYGTTYLDVLAAQQGLLSAQLAVITARNAQSRALINLYQALGGGR